jgi:hypothetical protein
MLETTIGRLTHVSMIIPPVHHFLSRLCKLHFRAKNNNQRLTNIPQTCIDDLKLMKKILKWGNDWISMNQIAYRKPTHVYQLDSCPGGQGGYSHKGFVWRYYLPEDLQFCTSNNLLEPIASIISPWIDIIAGRLKEGDCSLSLMDSTTSEGWTRKTNFKEDHDGIQATIKIQVARGHATRFMTHKIWEYSQWFPGRINNVADALSRDKDRSDQELTQIIFTHVPSQVPNSFKIVPLPSKIVSGLTLLLQKLPVQQRYSEVHTMTMLGCGNNGTSTAIIQDSQGTSFSQTSQEANEHTYSAVLPWMSVKGVFATM